MRSPEDKKVLEMINSATPEMGDLHKKAAAIFFGKKEEDVTPEERRAAKSRNYYLLYSTSLSKQKQIIRMGS